MAPENDLNQAGDGEARDVMFLIEAALVLNPLRAPFFLFDYILFVFLCVSHNLLFLGEVRVPRARLEHGYGFVFAFFWSFFGNGEKAGASTGRERVGAGKRGGAENKKGSNSIIAGEMVIACASWETGKWEPEGGRMANGWF